MPELQLKQLYDGFRDPRTVAELASQIKQLAAKLDEPVNVMEVCGGHTHTIMKYGLLQLLPDNIEFIHGPGCPVCIMPKERIDQAAALAQIPDVILVTLGDMIRVPGSEGSLAQFRAKGCDIRPIYMPLDALKIAQENPDKTVVYFAIGFETSTPMTAVLLEQAEKLGIPNLLFHINHVLVPPAIDAVMADPDTRVNAFIGPSHVSVITGSQIYQPTVDNYHTPVVVSGFEPVDVMQSILSIVKQKVEGRCALENQYERAVSYKGNEAAQQKVNHFFTVRPSFRWRGLGPIPNSALMLKPEYRHRDAELKYGERLPVKEIDDHKACQCGDILRGKAKPQDCKVFGRGCTPQTPLGSCMVSSEGACNAYYRYAGVK
ncbi:hydrogenase formation protein HypD [Shewanella yunxiaonensis]|uniref:Hydrogenase maturation factor n=1 Tax=Shewanella yunxiaonensis TaxID=2829809 RepID=A0ABX7YXB7_9GAMM|nr:MULTISPECIES: hydrogenase formation protein HypD [Shewanella]MDF0534389.1 hydrogenase formation protein HypD [Shewanella sp. A32]QUN07419.1 hydrogenase formation protein HypD [Shewanella yunxiaonensis]